MSATARADEMRRGWEHSRDLDLLWPLLGRRIAFHRRLVDLTASVKAAVLLSQAIYWTRHGRDIALAQGWFHKTSAQWELETGLSVKEQRSARHILHELGVLNYARHGAPAVLHFRLATGRLGLLLGGCLGQSARQLEWTDDSAVIDLLGPPLAYHRTLAVVGGGVHAGLLLSRALYRIRYSSARLAGGWFYASRAQWAAEIGLGRSEQEGARRELQRRGVWEESIAGVPPRIRVRVRMAALLALLNTRSGTHETRSGNTRQRDTAVGGIATNRKAGTPPSRRWDCHHQVLPKPANQFGQNQPISSAETSPLNVQGSTGCLVQTPPLPPAPGIEGRSAAVARPGGGDLILPQKLLPEERTAALALVKRCPEEAQALLDELAARLQKNTVHTSPIAYLRGMVQRALVGSFVPELAAGVSAARRRQAEAVLAREQHAADAQRCAAEAATPEFQQKVAQRRVQVRQMLEDMRARNRAQPPS